MKSTELQTLPMLASGAQLRVLVYMQVSGAKHYRLRSISASDAIIFITSCCFSKI